MHSMAPFTLARLCLAAALSVVGAASAQALDELRTEDGTPAREYTSTHRLRCGNTMIELEIASPHPVRVVRLVVDDAAVPAGQLQAFNAQSPGRGWFDGITSSCTSTWQALTLRVSTPTGPIALPLVFEGGRWVDTRER